MGQAKIRGTYEQRKKEGETKRKAEAAARQKGIAEIRERRLSTPRGRELDAYYAMSLGVMAGINS